MYFKTDCISGKRVLFLNLFNKSLSVISCLLFLLALPIRGWAEEAHNKWSFDGELRLRYEMMDGFNDKAYGDTVTIGESHDGFLLSRVRLGMTYTHNPQVIFKVSMQDSRAFDWSLNDRDYYIRS
jgi:hypothetical protein